MKIRRDHRYAHDLEDVYALFTDVGEIEAKQEALGARSISVEECEIYEDGVKRRIMTGTYVLSAGYYDAYYLKAQKVRQLIADDFRTAFESCDLIVSPTAPGTAFRLGEKADDPVSMYLQDIYTIAVNLAGLPGISIPAPLSGGMPVGLQLIGNYFDEARLLNAAHQLQLVTNWHQQAPAGFE